MAVAAERMMVSYFIRQNAYAGVCAICGADVAKREGWVQKSRAGTWETLCRGCVNEHARFVPIVTEGGQNLYGKSVANGGCGSGALGHCARCRAIVGLVKSKRGKWYFANTYPAFNDSGARRVYDFDAHDCDKVLARRGEEA